mgnify:CR=1 FL=1
MRYKNATITTENCSTKIDGGFLLNIETQRHGLLNLKVLQKQIKCDTAEILHMVFDMNRDEGLLFMFATVCSRDGWDFADNVCETSLGNKFTILYDDYYESSYEEIAKYILELENACYYTKNKTEEAIYDELSKNWN